MLIPDVDNNLKLEREKGLTQNTRSKNDFKKWIDKFIYIKIKTFYHKVKRQATNWDIIYILLTKN